MNKQKKLEWIELIIFALLLFSFFTFEDWFPLFNGVFPQLDKKNGLLIWIAFGIIISVLLFVIRFRLARRQSGNVKKQEGQDRRD